MKFRPVYYMISGWPSLEKTREMVRRYVEHGVTALQFDMPGADPSRESAFIQQGMRHARALYGEDYDVFMDALRGIRCEFPELEIHLVVYPDVVERIGLERFGDFCQEIGIYSVLPGDKDKMKYLSNRGSQRQRLLAMTPLTQRLSLHAPVISISFLSATLMAARSPVRDWLHGLSASDISVRMVSRHLFSALPELRHRRSFNRFVMPVRTVPISAPL